MGQTMTKSGPTVAQRYESAAAALAKIQAEQGELRRLLTQGRAYLPQLSSPWMKPDAAVPSKARAMEDRLTVLAAAEQTARIALLEAQLADAEHQEAAALRRLEEARTVTEAALRAHQGAIVAQIAALYAVRAAERATQRASAVEAQARDLWPQLRRSLGLVFDDRQERAAYAGVAPVLDEAMTEAQTVLDEALAAQRLARVNLEQVAGSWRCMTCHTALRVASEALERAEADEGTAAAEVAGARAAMIQLRAEIAARRGLADVG